MAYKLKIDIRETHLIELLGAPNDTIEVASLNLGDIQVWRDNGDARERRDNGDARERGEGTEKLVAIIERKTWSDLSASIKDGRYREQKMRLLSKRASDGCRLLYIFESDPRRPYAIKKETYRSCIVNTIFRDDIAVFESGNLEDTGNFLLKTLKNMAKYSSDFIKDHLGGSVSYASTLKNEKKANLTPELCFARQLAVIPGISVNIASRIAKVFPDMKSLISQLEEDTKPVSDINVGVEPSTRRLGKVKADRLKEFLLGED